MCRGTPEVKACHLKMEKKSVYVWSLSIRGDSTSIFLQLNWFAAPYTNWKCTLKSASIRSNSEVVFFFFFNFDALEITPSETQSNYFQHQFHNVWIPHLNIQYISVICDSECAAQNSIGSPRITFWCRLSKGLLWGSICIQLSTLHC